MYVLGYVDGEINITMLKNKLCVFMYMKREQKPKYLYQGGATYSKSVVHAERGAAGEATARGSNSASSVSPPAHP